MEKDDEVKGSGNSYDFGARIYDVRIGRWMSTDAFESHYAPISPFVFSLNNPNYFIDKDGNKIWDPVHNKEVTVTYENNSAIYTLVDGGEVSQKFIEDAKPVLDILAESETGRGLILDYSNLETEVVVDLNDPDNVKSLQESPSNSKVKLGSINEETGLYDRVVITPSIENISKSSLASGIAMEEKMIQTMSIEKDHIDDPNQISFENENYIDLYTNPTTFKLAYEEILNDAVRIGISYREEKGKPITESSFDPVINVQKSDIGYKVKLDKENKALKKQLK